MTIADQCPIYRGEGTSSGSENKRGAVTREKEKWRRTRTRTRRRESNDLPEDFWSEENWLKEMDKRRRGTATHTPNCKSGMRGLIGLESEVMAFARRGPHLAWLSNSASMPSRGSHFLLKAKYLF